MAVSVSSFFFGLIFLCGGVASVRSTKKSLSRHVEARRGENVTLPCDFKTDGAIELSMLIVHWSKDGVTKYFSNKTCCYYPGHDISEGDLQNGKAPLQLINVQDKDTGVYTCTIKYEDIEETWKTIVHVRDALLEVSVDPNVVANPGDTVQLKCHLLNIGDPLDLKNLMIQWYTKGKQVAEFDEKITIEKSGLSMSMEALKKGDATLTIQSFTAEHAGNYRCYVYYKTEHTMKQTVLSSKDASTQKESDLELSTCETVLDKKLDKVIDWISKVEGKLAEVTRTCSSRQEKTSTN